MKQLFYRFFPYIKEYIPQFIIALVGMLFAAGGTAGSAYLVKPVLDEIFINKDKELLYLLPYAIIAMYFAKGFGKYVQTYYTSYIGQDIVRRIRDKILKNILTLDLEFFYEFRKGELISRLINDVERVRNVVSGMIPDILRELFTIIALMGVVIYQNPKLAFLAFIILPLALYPLSKLAKKMRKLSRKSQEKISDITSILGEIFNNIEIIKANSTEKIESSHFEKDNLKFFKINMKSVKTSELVSPIMETLGAIGVTAVIMLGGSEVIEGHMSVGSFFSFMTALFMLYTPIKRISGIFNKMQDAVAASERIFYMLDLKPKIKSGSKKVPDILNSITFKHVSLKYKDNTALEDICFKTKRGEVTALVGDSGGGKSSLVNLIVRFYDPNNGKILFDDTDIKDFELESLRDSISIVTQRVYIFNDTIANNVAYGFEVDEQKVVESLKKAQAWEFVQKQQNGIHTILQEFGANLSGGQRQRIAIARAFYKNPKILILDEATSALDNKSEREIAESLKELEKERITFIIAHRLSTIEHADKILVLRHGKIICEGNDKFLIEHCKEYQKLKGRIG